MKGRMKLTKRGSTFLTAHHTQLWPSTLDQSYRCITGNKGSRLLLPAGFTYPCKLGINIGLLKR